MFTQSQIDQFHHDGTIVAKNLINSNNKVLKLTTAFSLLIDQ